MPTYEFTCPNGHDFDKFFRSMASAPTVVPCPVCGEPADRQMSAGAGLVFHGTGFYITDYGKDGKKDQKSAVGRKSESNKASDGESKSGDSHDSHSKPVESKTESGSGGSSGSEAKSGGESSTEAAKAPAKDPAKAVTPAKASE